MGKGKKKGGKKRKKKAVGFGVEKTQEITKCFLEDRAKESAQVLQDLLSRYEELQKLNGSTDTNTIENQEMSAHRRAEYETLENKYNTSKAQINLLFRRLKLLQQHNIELQKNIIVQSQSLNEKRNAASEIEKQMIDKFELANKELTSKHDLERIIRRCPDNVASAAYFQAIEKNLKSIQEAKADKLITLQEKEAKYENKINEVETISSDMTNLRVECDGILPMILNAMMFNDRDPLVLEDACVAIHTLLAEGSNNLSLMKVCNGESTVINAILKSPKALGLQLAGFKVLKHLLHSVDENHFRRKCNEQHAMKAILIALQHHWDQAEEELRDSAIVVLTKLLPAKQMYFMQKQGCAVKMVKQEFDLPEVMSKHRKLPYMTISDNSKLDDEQQQLLSPFMASLSFMRNRTVEEINTTLSMGESYAVRRSELRAKKRLKEKKRQQRKERILNDFDALDSMDKAETTLHLFKDNIQNSQKNSFGWRKKEAIKYRPVSDAMKIASTTANRHKAYQKTRKSLWDPKQAKKFTKMYLKILDENKAEKEGSKTELEYDKLTTYSATETSTILKRSVYLFVIAALDACFNDKDTLNEGVATIHSLLKHELIDVSESAKVNKFLCKEMAKDTPTLLRHQLIPLIVEAMRLSKKSVAIQRMGVKSLERLMIFSFNLEGIFSSSLADVVTACAKNFDEEEHPDIFYPAVSILKLLGLPTPNRRYLTKKQRIMKHKFSTIYAGTKEMTFDLGLSPIKKKI